MMRRSLVLGACLVVAACGGAAAKITSGQLSAVSTSATVVESTNATYGPILTDSRGLALYTYTADEPGGPGCEGSCLVLWPPLLLASGVTTPTGGPGVAGLGTFPRAGGLQVTYHGLPLYTYLDDVRPGLVTGQHVVDSGGTWVLATAQPSGAESPAPTTPGVPAPTVTQPATRTQPTATRPGQPVTTAGPRGAPPSTRPPSVVPPTNPPTTPAPTTTMAPPTTPAPTTTMAPPTTPPPTTPPGGGVSY